MSQENVEIVRKLYGSQGSDFYELLDPHVVWLNYASAPEPGPYLGHEGVHEWAKGWRATFGDFEIHPTEIIDAGDDQVVVIGRVSGAGTTSGAPVDREMAWLFTLLSRRIVRGQGFETRGEALEAAGLRE
jgi:ketosteroid isomerase-like protein